MSQQSKNSVVRITDVRDAADLVDPVSETRLIGLDTAEREAAKKQLRALQRLHAQEQTVLKSIESQDAEKAEGGTVCQAPATMRNVVRPTVVSKERPLAAHGAATPLSKSHRSGSRGGSRAGSRSASGNRPGTQMSTARSPSPGLNDTMMSTTTKGGTGSRGGGGSRSETPLFVTSEKEHEIAMKKFSHDNSVTVTTRVPPSLVPFTRLAEERKRLLAVGDTESAANLSLMNTNNQGGEYEGEDDNNNTTTSPARAGRLVPPNMESRGTTTQPMLPSQQFRASASGSLVGSSGNLRSSSGLSGTIQSNRGGGGISPGALNAEVDARVTASGMGTSVQHYSDGQDGMVQQAQNFPSSMSERVGALTATGGSSGGNAFVIRTLHQQRRTADRSMTGAGSEWRTFRAGSPEPSSVSKAARSEKTTGVRGKDPTLSHFLDAGRYNTSYVKPVDLLDAERREQEEKERLLRLIEMSESQVERAQHRKRLQELENQKIARQKGKKMGVAVEKTAASAASSSSGSGGDSSRGGMGVARGSSSAGGGEGMSNKKKESIWKSMRKKSFSGSMASAFEQDVSDMSMMGDSFHPNYSCYGCRAPYLFMMGDDKIVQYMRKCTLMSYDCTDNVYILQWDANDEPEEYKERMAQRDRAAAALGVQVAPRNQTALPIKRLSPLVIRFGGESETAFEARKNLAYELRDREEALIRLQSYADMTLQEQGSVEPMSEEHLERILRKATNNEAIPERHIVLAMELMKEVEESHDRALRSAVIEYQLRDPALQDKLRDLRLPQKAELAINPHPHTPFALSLEDPSPLIKIGERYLPFQHVQRWALREAFVLRPELYSGFFFSNRHWTKFEQQWLIDTEFEAFALPAKLEDFQARQASFTTEARRQLQHEWLGVIVTHLRGELVNTFNLYMDNEEVFRRSRAARYFKALNLSLGSRLQGLVYQTVERFRNWIELLDLPEDMADACADVRSGLEQPLHWPPFRALVGCSLHIEVIELSYRLEHEKRRIKAEQKRKEKEAQFASQRRRSSIFPRQHSKIQDRRASVSAVNLFEGMEGEVTNVVEEEVPDSKSKTNNDSKSAQQQQQKDSVTAATQEEAPILETGKDQKENWSDSEDEDGETDSEAEKDDIFAEDNVEDLSGPKSPAHGKKKKKVKMGRSLSGLVPVVITTLVVDKDGHLGYAPTLKEVEQTFHDIFLSIFGSTDDIVGVGSSFFELLELHDRPLTYHSQQLRSQDKAIISCHQLLDTVWKSNEAIPLHMLELFRPLESILTRSPAEVTEEFMQAGIVDAQKKAAELAAKEKAERIASGLELEGEGDDEDEGGGDGKKKKEGTNSSPGTGRKGGNRKKQQTVNFDDDDDEMLLLEEQRKAEAAKKSKEAEEPQHREPPKLEKAGVRLETDPTLADFKTICDRLFEYCRIVRGRSLGEVNTPIIKVETFSAKEHMIAHIMRVIGALLDKLIEWVTSDVAVADDQFGKIYEYIKLEPRSPEELRSLRDFVDKLPAKLEELEKFYEDISVRIQLLSEYGFLPPNHVFEMYWAGYSWPKKIDDILQDMAFQMLSFRAQFVMQLTEGMKSLEEEIKNLQRDVNMFAFEEREKDYEKNYVKVLECEEKLEKVRKLTKLYNTHEVIFSMAPTRFTALYEVEQQFNPHSQLWKLCAAMQDISKWNDLPLEKINADLIFTTTSDWTRQLAKLKKVMGMEPPAAVVETLKEKLDAFKPCIPVLTALARKAVLDKKRHQGKLSESLGVEKFELKEKSIVQLIEMGALNHVGRIDEIAENAEQEYRIDLQLRKMQDEWALTKFTLQKTETIILLRETDPLRLTLDEHITKTATMLASPFAGSMLDSIKLWEHTLSRVSKTLDAWLICQQGYNYLYPIFFGSDIALSLPEESRVFNQISEMWTALMESASKNSNVKSRCSDDKLLPQLTDANNKLDRIQRELVKFLDKKRQAFPRFFFLSNEDLIQILSETQDARLVQPHMKKLYEGIKEVELIEKPGWTPPPPTPRAEGDTSERPEKAVIPPVLLTAMIAPSKEKVALVEAVDPEADQNMVEKWLAKFELIMKKTLVDLFSKGMEEFIGKYNKDRNGFIEAAGRPGQVSMVVSSIQWTILMENAIRDRALHEAAQQTQEWLNELVLLVRRKLVASVLATVQAMIVLEVHNRDCAKDLCNNDCQLISDFSWMAQLRYYWMDQSLIDKHVSCKQTFAIIRYGNEYLGNATRLVITPLTDRCFRTLTSAYFMHYGGAPEGPAGTGKTESTKDLAKALGINCVVMNCSDQIKAAEFEKLLRGLASSGCWGCFDEFNRIELQVLSVIAQQVLTIQLAVTQKRQEFLFEGKMCALREGCSVFVTMNPGYAGRAELPDNLKALFRPVAMMVPDYALIAENSLYSCGFLQARALASKIVATYKLSSEQLSSQSHYDYGMRAVKSVLNAAEAFRKKTPEEDESVLVLRSIADVNVPKFLTNDAMLFRWILGDLFRGVELNEIKLESLEQGMILETEKLGLTYSDFFQIKMNQIWSTMGVRHGLMVVGGSISGKNSALTCLSGGLTWARQNKQQHEETFMHKMNPKALTSDHMYGFSDAAGTEWFDGVLSIHFRNSANDTSLTRRHWLVLDGPVDAVWIENMNTVLDDNKKLCLANGDVIRMTDLMTMVFVAQDLAAASPATVSRCGMIYFEPNQLGAEPLIKSWLEGNIPEILCDREEPKAIFTRLIEKTVEPIRTFIAKEAILGCAISAQVLTYRFFEFLTIVLEDCFKDISEEVIAAASETDLTIYLEGCYVFAVVWTFGASIRDTGRPQFDKWLRIGFTGKDAKNNPVQTAPFSCPIACTLPAENDRSLFDVAWIVPKSLEGEATWVDWMGTLDLGKATGGGEKKKPAEGGGGAEGAGGGDANAAATAAAGGGGGGEGGAEGEGGGEGHNPARRVSAPKDLADLNVLEMIVPTPQTVSTMYIARQTMSCGVPILLNGATGSGKSLLLKQAANQFLNPTIYKNMVLPLSANTTTGQLQKAVGSRLERRGVGRYVPPLGCKMLLIVDDLGMPEPDKYGTQRPIELLRQLLAMGGWHAIGSKTGAFHSIDRLLYAGAMQPADSGRAMVTQRLLRRYHNVYLPPQDAAAMKMIFTTIMDKILMAQGMCQGLRGVRDNVVSFIITLYHAVSDAFLPTPSHPHYTFNIRDLLRTVQGLTACRGNSIKDETTFVTAITHECIRSFSDRLISDGDVHQFKTIVKSTLTKVLRVGYELVVPCEPLVYSDFLPTATEIQSAEMGEFKEQQKKEMQAAGLKSSVEDVVTVVESEAERTYKPILNFSAANKETNALVAYANTDSLVVRQGRLQMIAFDYVSQHVSRIVRIIQAPRGAALLVGPGGSGRRSCARLAAFIAGHVLKQIHPQKKYNRDVWTDDFTDILRHCGERAQPTTFLLPENHIVDECILEDVNCFLNVGDVPGLFNSDTQDQIFGAMGPACREAQIETITMDAALNLFWQRCRTNLHLIITMSPVGAGFRSNVRKFPALVACSTIDWFLSWPLDGLLAVGHSVVARNEEWSEPEAKFIVETGVTMYEQTAKKFAQAKDLKLPVKLALTPSVFLDLLDTFEAYKKQKTNEYVTARDRYVNGVDVLIRTQKMVGDLQEELEAAAPKIEAASKNTAELVERVDKDAAEVDIEAKAIGQEEVVAAEIAAQAGAVKDECQQNLAVAMPAMNAAVAAVSSIDKKQLIEIRSLNQPPEKAKPVFEAICIVLEEAPRRIKDSSSTAVTYDYWTPMKTKVMADIDGFKNRLLTFDKENMKPEIFEKAILPYTTSKAFKPEAVASVSQALVGLVQWVLAMETYYKVYKVVKPKMIKLKAAEDSLASANKQLAEKRAILKEITDRLDALKQQLADAISEKRRLEAEQKLTETKLNRAKRVLNGLKTEKDRYKEAAEGFGKKLLTVSGDALVAAAIVVLQGPLPQSVRLGLKEDWINLVQKSLLPCTEPFDLESFLGDAATTLHWRICGLPSDAFSVDNALIFFNTRRTAFLIDPHDQAGAWIKTMERVKEGGSQRFAAVRASDKGLLQTVVNAVKDGSHVLIEGCSESIDSALMPVVLRQYSTYEGKKIISVGDVTLPLHEKFRITLSTRIATPSFMTDTSSAVCLTGFFVTKDGLQEQLLQKTLQHEEREQDKKRSDYIESGAKSKLQLRQIEDNILTMISTRTDLLESDEVVNQLENSKKTAAQLETRMTEIEAFQKSFEKIRMRYVPLAAAGAQIYTSVTSLAFVEGVYQFSLMWYLRLYMLSLATEENEDEQEERRFAQEASANFEHEDVRLDPLMAPVKTENTLPPLVIKRVNECFEKLLRIVHRDMTRATFQKDHVVAEMLITTGLSIHTEHQEQEWTYLVRGRPPTAEDIHPDRHPLTRPSFLKEAEWNSCCQLTEDLEGVWHNFSQDVSKDEDKEFSNFVDQCFKMTIGELPPGAPFPSLPSEYASKFKNTPFQKVLFVNTLYPPLVVAAAREYLVRIRGPDILNPAPVDINAIIEQNPDPTSVILFVMSPGVDPQQSWRAAASDHNMSERIDTLSLGMGMADRAKQLIDDAKSMGRWVLLQNLHLYKDFMPQLDRVVQDLALLASDASSSGSPGSPAAKPRGLHAKFRLWLTAAPTENVPPSIWFRCLKCALEPPQGLKSGIQRALLSPNLSDPAFFNSTGEKVAPLWRRICFALCAFDAVLHERKRFGPVGWNIPYGFSEADLSTAVNQVQRLIKDYDEVPLEAASYLIGECFYGGRVTDAHDRTILQAILEKFLRTATEEVGAGTAGIPMPVETEIVPAPSENDKSPGWKLLDRHAKDKTSDEPNPEACGLHISANLTRLHRDALMLKESISNALPPAVAAPKKKKETQFDSSSSATSAASSSKQQQPGSPMTPSSPSEAAHMQKREVTPVELLCVDILKSLHKIFDVEAVQQARPMSYEDVMNTVLLLELGRYNKLLDKMHKTIKGLVRALRGEAVMSAELESIREDIERGRLPAAWKDSCYPSLRPFASFMTDLGERMQMLDTWIKDGPPIVVWLGGLYFPQPFVTGAMQNFSREVGVAIDRIEWEFTVVQGMPTEAAEQGCFVGGLYLEAGGWSFENTRCGLTDPSPTELTIPFPVLKLTPVVPPVKKDSATGGGGGGGGGGRRKKQRGNNASGNDFSGEDDEDEDDGEDEDEDADEEDDEDDENVVTSVPFVAYEVAESAAQAGPWKRVPRHTAHPTQFYHCPLYRTYERRGVLSTTGHSTNFIFRVALPIAPSAEKIVTAEYYLRRGSALFTSSE